MAALEGEMFTDPLLQMINYEGMRNMIRVIN